MPIAPSDAWAEAGLAKAKIAKINPTILATIAASRWRRERSLPRASGVARAVPALRTGLDAVGKGALDVTVKTGEWGGWVNAAFDVIYTKFPLASGADIVVSVLHAEGLDDGCWIGAKSNTIEDCPARAFFVKDGAIAQTIDFTTCFAAYNPAEGVTALTLARVDVQKKRIEIETRENGKASCPVKRVDAARLFDSLK